MFLVSLDNRSTRELAHAAPEANGKAGRRGQQEPNDDGWSPEERFSS
jgi:hypothetical protein